LKIDEYAGYSSRKLHQYMPVKIDATIIPGRNSGKRMNILLLGTRVDDVVLLNSMGDERTNTANAPNVLMLLKPV
jgi:hypothetical protein